MAGSDIDSITKQLAGASVDSQAGLSFAGRGIKMDSEADAKEIIDAINACKELKWLRLEGNTLGVEAAKPIAMALEKHPEFQRALWSDMFTGRLKTEIPGALRLLGNGIIMAGAQLVELDLSDNAFGPNGMEGLVDFLKSRSCYSLKELRLNNNGLGVTGGKMLATSLLECYKKSSTDGTPLALRVFVSGRGRLENEGSKHLAEAFKAMGSLEEVSMPQNGIFHQGIMALADAFACNPKLRKLDLSDNIFTEQGAKAMAKALPHLVDLEVINFGDCLIKTGGVKAIAKVVEKSNPKLKEVVLSFNEIKTPGAEAVTKALCSKPSLVKLDLNGNMLGDDGGNKVREIMENAGRDSVLGSFSDDEGSEDEEEGSDQDDEDEGIEINDPGLEIKGVSLTPRSIVPEQETIKVEDFFQKPSATAFLSLGPNRTELISNHVYKDDVIEVVSSAMKLASVVSVEDEKVKAAVCDCVDLMLEEMLASGDDTTKARLSNEILIHLGLMKSENKKFEVQENLTGPLIVLEHVVKKDYFPKMAKDILQMFVGKPNARLDAQQHGPYKHKLLQALFQ